MKKDRETTERGFINYNNFKDTYGSEIVLRESSAVGEQKLWIFCKNESWDNPSPHINAEQAKLLIKGLERFVRDAESPNNWRNDPEYIKDWG